MTLKILDLISDNRSMVLRFFCAFILILFTAQAAPGQDLENVVPILLGKDVKKDSGLYVLTIGCRPRNWEKNDSTISVNPALNKDEYKTSIEIIDAQAPWPPRWFATAGSDSTFYFKNSSILPLNVSEQFGKLVYYTVTDTVLHQKKHFPPVGYIFLNDRLEPVDTLMGQDFEMDPHDLSVSKNGERVYFVIRDTTVHATIHNQILTKIITDNIEIADLTGKVVFRWDPLVSIGLNAQYPNYCCNEMNRMFSKHSDGFDWTRGSSVCFDDDGNILYSYRGVGIGKISRTDGSIIWRIDRTTQKMNAESDIIPIYHQHDFKSVKLKDGRLVYTVLSNGDDLHDYCRAYQFTVSKNAEGKYLARLLKKVTPKEKMPATRAGNYDLLPDGKSMMCYGFIYEDRDMITAPHKFPLFETVDSAGNLTNAYLTQTLAISYRAHPLEHIIPSRPVIINTQGLLSTTSSANPVWYQLLNTTPVSAKKVSEGSTYKPKTPGVFCAVTKYGIGYAVSLPEEVK